MGKAENRISDLIRVGLSDICVLVRSPAGLFYQGKFAELPGIGRVLKHLRPVKVLDEGWPDLTGWRRRDGRMVLIEVKTPRGRVSARQQHLIDYARSCGVLAGVARSVEDARRIVEGNDTHDT